ncbi:MAG: histidine--tRNA ligase [Candidatus Altiarchaeota archaeon]|nr:histidine--tRNA ligase [Candidatus Altiarchaeota archaeon]
MVFERPRGVRDFTPENMRRHLAVSDSLEKTFASFGYDMVRTPTFEFLSLFEAKSGEDIKEHLYVFEDKGGRSICLRPEATASVARMYGSELRTHPKPLRLYYIEPMFRYEQPQKGRYREFWQAGVELIGVKNPYSDAEVILLAYESLRNLGLTGKLRISHIGVLRGLLSEAGFDETRQNKVVHALDKGDLKSVEEMIVDKVFSEVIKLTGGIEVCEKLESIIPDNLKSLVNEFTKTIQVLEKTGVEYVVDFSMARGLDYYTGIIFDIKAEGLGAQNQICGGGRYDNLIGLFEGPETPAIGFAFGIDRLVEALTEKGYDFEMKCCDVFVLSVGDSTREGAFSTAADLRRKCPGLEVRFDISGSKIGKALQQASDLKARYAVIFGEKEFSQGNVVVKDLDSEEQETISLDDLTKYLSDRAPD